jgi:hypothetical protein
MFEDIVTRLIAGQFVCQVSDPEGYQYLCSSELVNGRTRSNDIDLFLGRVGMKLSSTQSGAAYYVSYRDTEDKGRKAAKALFTEMKTNLRMLVDFFKLIMDATGNDFAVTPGQKVDLNKLTAIVSQNQSLIESLRKVSTQCRGVGGESDRSRMDKVAKKLKQDGYLAEMNKEQDIYLFTGKIEYFHDTLMFLMTHDEISEEDEEFNDKVSD